MNRAARRVCRVWQYPEGDSYFAPLWECQRLDRCNTVIGWGRCLELQKFVPTTRKGIELELGGSPTVCSVSRGTVYRQVAAPLSH